MRQSMSPFPFLSLPPEVRLQVYHYLIPNIPVRNFSLIRNKRPPLRRDGQPCCPALLRANHAIHTEAIREWYSAAAYEVIVDAKYILFCGKILAPYVPLPSTIRYVTTMHLCIALQRTPLHLLRPEATAPLEHLLGFQDRLVTLAKGIGDPVGRRLRTLLVEIEVDVPLLLSLSKTPAELLELLRWNLDPVRQNVRSVEVVNWEVKEQSYGIQSQEFLAAYGELRTVMHRFLENMREEMVSDKDNLV
ncbi:hypothetical protein LV164_005659 [Aspergillus fumigatus]|uniref:F-box domain-containing protein n=3 Tax=Aspergillus fumigatus TaxID=746128 RepID=Q4WC42_ASPFU|nr:conserved hypothetical protein [Aspergillus fumigatus Af293]EDP48734.1 conserved hypothetical protein [Aspergillus fumigatus A1163]KAF4255990.1 hypothetical protein CNMCM8057_004283 [Aspergillus fumigatus]EAL85342.1 conserved hypothetical protein [Aspergillus fumigatus Af293]KAF4264237.1 hypothetical protein CNMCM8714_007630 [Aspergillus fumigatus]KAF4266208.1 hypothetical protein CNMCM8812_002804 [Aspergillus fumigatus]